MNQGRNWKEVSYSLFGGEGSFGNGASMRVTPVGAFFADDILAVRTNAALSAEVTHAHPEAAAGAIAVSLAAAYAYRLREKETPTPTEFMELVVKGVPDSMTRRGILKAIEVPSETPTWEVARLLGSGQQVTTQDTIPYAIWCAAHYISDYENALWNTVAGYGDMDTTCAIVGGIVVMFTGERAIPPDWIESREELPTLPL
jgi:ADP-ribosylglycohydrolase